MTIEEAIKGIHTLTDRISLADDRQDAIDMAIRSLEAWEKVKKEIDDSISACESDAMRNTWCDGELAGFLQSKDIINENLSEVSKWKHRENF